MALTPGARLGVYDITAPIGEGGMGQVYRATDTTLGRQVAIKILPDAFAADPHRLARFEREAKTLASLNHPHIATIYGFEKSGGLHLLVMELVEGDDLSQRLARGAIPLDEALPIAKQIADALEAAHEQGIIHRDLKPANIKVRPDGTVKVLDFGLAKAIEPAGTTSASSSMSPTIPLMTEAGIILGTAAYMSPEQARGKTIDKRADIWAFGCVLYEMLAGSLAFGGETSSDRIARVLTQEPDWQALPEATPGPILVLIRRCLEKSSQRRLRDIGDARLEIETALTEPARVAVPAGGPKPTLGTGPRWRQATLGLSLLLVTLVIAVAVWKTRTSASVRRVPAHLVLSIPPAAPVSIGVGPSVAFSPNGTSLAYVARSGSTTQLYLRLIDQLEARAILGTQGAEGPFFSPDGQWIGFFADHKLKKIGLRGGEPVTLCGAPVGLGASWGTDDRIIFASVPDSGLLRVSAAGGTAQVLTTLDLKTGENGHYWPEILPGNKAVMFSVITNTGEPHIAVRRLDTGEQWTLIDGGTNAHYAATGHIVVARVSALRAVPFDLSRLQVTGPPFPILEGVLNNPFSGAQYSFSDDGSLAYIPAGAPVPGRTLVWVDRRGMARALPAPPQAYMDPRVSPDGQRVALEIVEGARGDIWIYELKRGSLTRFTSEGFENETPMWTPDGQRLAFGSSRNGVVMSLFWKAADGSGAEERIWTSDHHMHLGSFSPDGRWLTFADYHPITSGDIGVIPLQGDHTPQPWLRTSFHEWGAVFSPDGFWLAYVSNESGRNQIYVQAFPGPGRKWQISVDGGTEPVWARNGRELFFRDGDKLFAVATQTRPVFSAGPPDLLFQSRYERGLTLGHINYDVAPDGQHFLMVQGSEQEAAPTQLSVIVNWFEELNRRVPTLR